VVLESHPYYNVPQDANEDIIGSVYNYHMIMETVHRGSQAHNPAYLVSLAQLTYEKLTGAPLANAVAPGD
jgi:hypothetical protein